MGKEMTKSIGAIVFAPLCIPHYGSITKTKFVGSMGFVMDGIHHMFGVSIMVGRSYC
jgi:hypothetical protein